MHCHLCAKQEEKSWYRSWKQLELLMQSISFSLIYQIFCSCNAANFSLYIFYEKTETNFDLISCNTPPEKTVLLS